MELKQWHGFCLCPLGGACPPDSVPADAPFSPLVFLVRRDPLRSRGLFAAFYNFFAATHKVFIILTFSRAGFTIKRSKYAPVCVCDLLHYAYLYIQR